MGNLQNKMHRIKKLFLSVCVAVIALSSCGGNAEEMDIEKKALEYLSGRYSANFTITDISRKSTASPGPIPTFFASHYWELAVVSDQFPEDTFYVRYNPKRSNEDRWRDDYFTLLLDEEAKAYFSDLLTPYLEVKYLVDIYWGDTLWPEGTGEGSTTHEWLQAGGVISYVHVYLKNVAPEENDFYKAVATAFFQTEPNVYNLYIHGLATEGYETAISNTDLLSLWKQHPEWHMGTILYNISM